MAHVVAFSGGKDSTAMLLRLMETEPNDYTVICTPTHNELPSLFNHIALIEELAGVKVLTLGTPDKDDLFSLIRKMKMIPNWRARWCTRVLKIEPCIEFFATLPKESVLYVGLRADEEERRGLYGEDFNVRFPLREWGWGLANVKGYLLQRGVVIPRRTDCALCFHQRIGEWWLLWRDHPDKFEEGVAIEAEIGATFRSPGRDTWPSSLAALRQEFAKGRLPRGQEKRDDSDLCRVCSL